MQYDSRWVIRTRLKPIAVVRNGIGENIGDWGDLVSRLAFEPEYAEGLCGIERLEHIWVVSGFHKKKGWRPMVHPRKDSSRPTVGVLATRSPIGPNRLGLTRVELLEVRHRTVTVRELDAFDGSPVYDIKPDEDELRRQRRAAPRKTR